jgi:hypothetical protein
MTKSVPLGTLSDVGLVGTLHDNASSAGGPSAHHRARSPAPGDHRPERSHGWAESTAGSSPSHGAREPTGTSTAPCLRLEPTTANEQLQRRHYGSRVHETIVHERPALSTGSPFWSTLVKYHQCDSQAMSSTDATLLVILCTGPKRGARFLQLPEGSRRARRNVATCTPYEHPRTATFRDRRAFSTAVDRVVDVEWSLGGGRTGERS